MPDIYDFDTDIVVPNLTAPVKRLPKFLAWLKSLTQPIQTAWENLFVDWKTGSDYLDYNGATTYNLGDKIVWSVDKCVYEAASITALGIGQSFSGVPPSNPVFWQKLNSNFIGADERITYNSQIIILEHALNKWFQNLTATDQIFINTNSIASNLFLMGETGAYSSAMANNGPFANFFMPNTPNYPTQYNFTINVPAALFATLGTNSTNRENTVRTFADKYVLAGITYNVTTYP